MTTGQATSARAAAIFRSDLSSINLRTDRMFCWLLLAQWLAAIVVALVWSPRTWIAQYWSLHQHVLAAALLGGLFAAYPLYLIRRRPGARYTRHIIAIGQMLQSALLVHVTGGRIETHFHVFGSLALLAFYRDWPVLLTASAVVYLDHLALGVWFPLSVYGVTVASVWRSVEHAWWVVFEAAFLTISCRTGIKELLAIADREAALEDASTALQTSNQQLETRVAERTAELSSEIAEHQRTETELRKFSMAMDQAGDSVFITDKDGVVEYVNPAFQQLTGYTQADIVGQTPRILKSGQHAAAFYQQLWAAIVDGHAFRAVFINKKKNGELFYEQKTISPLKNAQGQITHFVSVGKDITEQQRAAQALEAKVQELKQLNRFMMGREERILELKADIKQLRAQPGAAAKEVA